MSQTIQSKAVCVNCLEVFVWLIVVMSWGWQNRCSLPRYLPPPPFFLPLSPTFYSSALCIPFICHYPCFNSQNCLSPFVIFFSTIVLQFFSYLCVSYLPFLIHFPLCQELFFISFLLSNSTSHPHTHIYWLPCFSPFFPPNELESPFSMLWIIQACNMLSAVSSIKAASIKRTL